MLQRAIINQWSQNSNSLLDMGIFLAPMFIFCLTSNLQIVGVADKRKFVRTHMQKIFDIPSENVFEGEFILYM